MDLKNKLVCFDLDGTLADHTTFPKPYSIEVLKKLNEQGVKIVIVTGRQWISSKAIYESLNLNTLCVLCNGNLVYDPIENKKYRDVKIDKDIIFSLINNEKFMEYIQDMLYENYMTTYSLTGKVVWNKNQIVGDFRKTMKEAPNSFCLVLKDRKYIPEVKKIVTSYENMNFRAWNVAGEIYNVKNTKLDGIKVVLDHYNLTKDDLIFFGDAENDIEALEYAKYGVAMKNASDDVKKHAAYVTLEDNENDGAVKFLELLMQDE